MLVKSIEGRTRELGREQGYIPLPIRDVIEVTSEKMQTHHMITAWEPTPAEIAAIVAGAPILVRIMGVSLPIGTSPVIHYVMSSHPPIVVETGEPPAK